MKQFIRRYISMALFLLLGVSAFAGGKVEVADDESLHILSTDEKARV